MSKRLFWLQSILASIFTISLIALIGSAWFPPRCPYLKKAIFGCPNSQPQAAIISPAEEEINRVAHQTVSTSLVSFAVDAQDYRAETAIRFQYRGDTAKGTIYLQVKNKNGYADLALVSQPLLRELTWNKVSEDNLSLFQRKDKYYSVSYFLANLPPAWEIAADRVAAAQFKLKPSQYTPLENISDFYGISYVLTTYQPPSRDNSWYNYNQTFNLSNANVNTNHQLEFAIAIPDFAVNKPSFLIGTVHVDYQKMRP